MDRNLEILMNFRCDVKNTIEDLFQNEDANYHVWTNRDGCDDAITSIIGTLKECSSYFQAKICSSSQEDKELIINFVELENIAGFEIEDQDYITGFAVRMMDKDIFEL